MNVIFADLIIAAFCVPFDTFAALQHGWKIGETMCNIVGFAHTLCGKLSTNIIRIEMVWILYNLLSAFGFFLIIHISFVITIFFRHGVDLYVDSVVHLQVIIFKNLE